MSLKVQVEVWLEEVRVFRTNTWSDDLLHETFVATAVTSKLPSTNTRRDTGWWRSELWVGRGKLVGNQLHGNAVLFQKSFVLEHAPSYEEGCSLEIANVREMCQQLQRET